MKEWFFLEQIVRKIYMLAYIAFIFIFGVLHLISYRLYISYPLSFNNIQTYHLNIPFSSKLINPRIETEYLYFIHSDKLYLSNRIRTQQKNDCFCTFQWCTKVSCAKMSIRLRIVPRNSHA